MEEGKNMFDVMWRLFLLSNKFLKMEGEEEGRGKGGSGGGNGLLLIVGDDDVERHNSCCSGEDNNCTVTSRPSFIDVPHVRQLCSWDCGLACVLMVLRTLGIDHCDILDLGKVCSTTSIWTIDLAYLLHKFSVSFSFFTVTLGANPDFSAEAFYKEQLQDDLGRVDRLFQKALEAGIRIQVYQWQRNFYFDILRPLYCCCLG